MSRYATQSDLNLYGLPLPALQSLVSSDLDGYLAQRFDLPLVEPIPVSIKQKVCQIAQWELLSVRGFNPELGSHVIVRQRFEDAIAWCRDVAAARVTPQVTDSTPGESGDGPFAVSAQTDRSTGVVVASAPRLRGWR